MSPKLWPAAKSCHQLSSKDKRFLKHASSQRWSRVCVRRLYTEGSNQTGRSGPLRNYFKKIINIISKYIIIFKIFKKHPKYHFLNILGAFFGTSLTQVDATLSGDQHQVEGNCAATWEHVRPQWPCQLFRLTGSTTAVCLPSLGPRMQENSICKPKKVYLRVNTRKQHSQYIPGTQACSICLISKNHCLFFPLQLLWMSCYERLFIILQHTIAK